jgi:DNA/RNA endonuclease YhcR with UshA esterase domain
MLLLLPVICAALSAAQAAPPNYSAAEAAKHVGETATVTGKVDGVNQSARGNIFLDIGGKEPNQAFRVLIPAASAAMFSRPQQFQGRIVAVSGKIALSKGKPQIVVNSPSQISTK